MFSAILQYSGAIMRILFGMIVMKSRAMLVVLVAMVLASCSSSSKPDQPPVTKADKPFAASGSIEMRLDGGGYTIRAASDDRIRISFEGNTGNAAAELSVSGSHANLSIRDT